MDIKKSVRNILSGILEISTEQANDIGVDDALDEKGLTSLRFIDMIVALEDTFNIEVKDSDLIPRKFNTISDITQMISKYTESEDHPVSYKKVVFCDCDNVLWTGVSGEGDIRIEQENLDLQQTLVGLTGRGVIICLCSKNDPENISEAFDKLPMVLTWEHIVTSRVNYKDKPDNIVDMLTELNLLSESAVFIDDSDYELEYVKHSLPEITTIKFNSSISIGEKLNELFDTSSEIDRTTQYKEQLERERLHTKNISADEFNELLNTEVQIRTADTSDIQRIAELTQRTNQFNLSAKHYTEDEIRSFILGDSVKIFVLSASDKFGDMGIVGCAIVAFKEQSTTITDIFLSCRVFGRGFEERLLDTIRSQIAGAVYGVFNQNNKNKKFSSFYSERGVIPITDI